MTRCGHRPLVQRQETIVLSCKCINFRESLPCNRNARRRSRPVGQWLSEWVPEPKEKDFCEPMQEAFIQKDAPDGVMGKIYTYLKAAFASNV
jgi:hypothetical protein